MTKVKVFVHAHTDVDADLDANARTMTLAPQTYLSRLTKNLLSQTAGYSTSLFSRMNTWLISNMWEKTLRSL